MHTFIHVGTFLFCIYAMGTATRERTMFLAAFVLFGNACLWALEL